MTVGKSGDPEDAGGIARYLHVNNVTVFSDATVRRHSL